MSTSQRVLPVAIGRFRVGGLLGTGAFSAVYLAADDRVGSDVAVKLLADHHSLDPDIRERFIAEARLLRRLTSPHVVRLYELDETVTHQPFHVLEYVAGGNLAAHRRARLDAGASVTAADLAHIARDLTAALGVLHAERIVHRDLAPKNLLVRPTPDAVDGERSGGNVGLGVAADMGGEHARTGSGSRRTATDRPHGVMRPGEQLVLADLGISKDLADSSGFTAAAGTLGYAAPEQRTVGTVDERADVYAASAVLAWMVTGEHPTEYRPEQLADRIAATGFAPGLADVLAGGLAHQPAARPPTIARWHDDVLAALDGPAHDAADGAGNALFMHRPDGHRAVGPPRSSSTRATTADTRSAVNTAAETPTAVSIPESPTATDPTATDPTATDPTTVVGRATPTLPATPALPRPRRRWRLAVAAVVLAIVGAAGGIAIDRNLRSDNTPAAPTVDQLDDGQVRVSQRNGEIAAAFTAPATLRPGETVRVVADVEGTADWVWIIPTARTAGTHRIDLTAPTSGSITLRLVAIGTDGTTAEAAYTFRVAADSQPS